MKISKYNYEYYLNLFLERQLDPVKTAELMLFLSENPDLGIPHDNAGDLLLHPDRLNFPLKDLLKKDFGDFARIDDSNFDEFCIAGSEGLLDDYNEERLDRYISQHPDKESELTIYRQLKLKADAQIHFPGKSALKKPVSLSPQYRILLLAASIAASVMLLLFIFTGNPENTSSRETYAAHNVTADTIIIYVPDPAELHIEISASDTKYAFVETAVHQKSDFSSDTILSGESETKEREKEEVDFPLMDPVHTINLASHDYSGEMALAMSDPGHINYGLAESPDQLSEDAGSSGNKLIDYIRGLNAWETALIALEGFNLLTESSLSIEKVSDDQGRITQIVIDTGERTLFTTGKKQPDL
ncbi:MAG: hypothetical protein JXB19_09655 [Bacteroidales bacterium]|nr:hypothetical protein [Bacteroidales bacterium]